MAWGGIITTPLSSPASSSSWRCYWVSAPPYPSPVVKGSGLSSFQVLIPTCHSLSHRYALDSLCKAGARARTCLRTSGSGLTGSDPVRYRGCRDLETAGSLDTSALRGLRPASAVELQQIVYGANKVTPPGPLQVRGLNAETRAALICRRPFHRLFRACTFRGRFIWSCAHPVPQRGASGQRPPG